MKSNPIIQNNKFKNWNAKSVRDLIYSGDSDGEKGPGGGEAQCKKML